MYWVHLVNSFRGLINAALYIKYLILECIYASYDKKTNKLIRNTLGGY